MAQPWLRRLVGLGTVTLETAAAREGGDGTAENDPQRKRAAKLDRDTVKKS